MTDTMDRPTTTGSASADGRPPAEEYPVYTRRRIRLPLWAYLVAIGVVAVIVGAILMQVSHAREVSNLKDEKVELQRAAYERELNGLAKVNETNTVYTVKVSDQSMTGFWAVSTTTNASKGDTVCERPMFLPDGKHSFPWFKDVPLDGSPDGAYCVTKVAKPGG